MTSSRVATSATPGLIISNGAAGPPPNRNVGASMFIVRNSGVEAVFLGDEDEQTFELPAGSAFTVGPVGPGDELWASSTAAGQVDILRHDAN